MDHTDDQMPSAYEQGQVLGEILQRVTSIEKKLDTKVDQEAFAPVKAIVYGLVGLLMMAVVGAMVAGVVKAVELVAL